MPNLDKDIYRGFKFTVEILGFTRASFQKVSGLKTSIEVVDYREGNNLDRVEKLAGMVTYDTVTLERGLSTDSDFMEWMKKVTNVVGVGGQDIPDGGLSDFGADSYRQNITINLHNKQGKRVKSYKLMGAFPSEYSIGDFDATSNDVVISTLVLQHHGIEEKSYEV